MSSEDRFPLVVEFSFDYDATSESDECDLEEFPPQMVAKVNRFFEALQKQFGWIDLNSTIKTAFWYEGF